MMARFCRCWAAGLEGGRGGRAVSAICAVRCPIRIWSVFDPERETIPVQASALSCCSCFAHASTLCTPTGRLGVDETVRGPDLAEIRARNICGCGGMVPRSTGHAGLGDRTVRWEARTRAGCVDRSCRWTASGGGSRDTAAGGGTACPRANPRCLDEFQGPWCEKRSLRADSEGRQRRA